MFRKHMVSKLCAAAILCSGQEVSAQTIFKQTDATGHTTFTDRPAADSMVVLSETDSSHQHTLPSPRIATGTRSDVANALSSNAAMASTYAATVDFNEARRRLKQARETRQAGMEPRPGERTDSTGTGAMNKRYQNRQRRLEREVVAAERRSHETSLARSALLRSDGKTDPLKLAQP
jgi:hypothetical protein